MTGTHRIGTIGVGTVVNLERGRVAWIGRSLSESQRVCREILNEYPGNPLAAIQSRYVVPVDVEDIVDCGSQWAPEINELTICGVPDDDDQWEHFAVVVHRHAGGMWTVRSRNRHVDRAGAAAHISRDADWEPYVMPLGLALDVATAYAKTITLRGRTAAEYLTWKHREAA